MDNRKVTSRKGRKLTKRSAADHVFVHFYFPLAMWTRDTMIFHSRLFRNEGNTCTHAALTSASVRVLLRCRVSARLRTNREQRCSLFRLVISMYILHWNFSLLLSGFLDPSSLLDWIIVKESRVNLVVKCCTISFRFLSAFFPLESSKILKNIEEETGDSVSLFFLDI